MNCSEAIQQLGAALDGEIPQSAAAALHAHLAGCAACRERFAQEAVIACEVSRALRTSPDQAADDAAWARALVVATVAPPAAPPGSAGTPWWSRLRQPPTRSQLRWFALVASLALLATFSMAGLGLRRSLHIGAPPAADPLITVPGAGR